jgi:hypothetical protein
VCWGVVVWGRGGSQTRVDTLHFRLMSGVEGWVVPCPVTLDPTGRCPVAKDTQLILPGSYTRIAFCAPARNGLYVWHW